jgi:hypothetical protein
VALSAVSINARLPLFGCCIEQRSFPMNRRAFLSGLGAFAAALSLSHWLAGEVAAQGQTFSRIVVDTKPMEARGGGAAAAVLRPRLQAALQREFSGRIARGGPVLVARVHSVQLSIFSGVERGGTPTDYLEGEVIAGGQAFPMLVTQSSDAGGAWYLPDNEARRLTAIADSFASWIRRRV